MTKLSTNPYKGSRDFYPEDKRILNYMFAKMRIVVEGYGYEEYDAPILEDYSLYAAKSGTEIVDQQTYFFEDRGGRKVAIRPEMTPSVSRLVAKKRQELSYPLRLYSIPNLWRYERQQRGRFREHWQLNVDLFGLDGIQADNEIINIADQIFQSFGAKRQMYQIKVSSRQFIEYFFESYLKLTKEKSTPIMKLIDRYHKIGPAEFINEVDKIIDDEDRSRSVVEKLIELIKTNQIKELPEELKSSAALAPLIKLFELNKNEITNLVFDASIMRGFDYYTDIVFEVFDTDPDNNRSMMGGGRYDGLVGLFGVEPISTVGFGLGDATLSNFLNVHGLIDNLAVETDIYAIFVDEASYRAARPVLSQLRTEGLKVAEGWIGKKIGDQINVATKKKIPYVLIIGPNELRAKKFTLRQLALSEEFNLSISEIVTFISDSKK